eukprot:6614998-Pyramimonas_sp.AAC.1
MRGCWGRVHLRVLRAQCRLVDENAGEFGVLVPRRSGNAARGHGVDLLGDGVVVGLGGVRMEARECVASLGSS